MLRTATLTVHSFCLMLQGDCLTIVSPGLILLGMPLRLQHGMSSDVDGCGTDFVMKFEG